MKKIITNNFEETQNLAKDFMGQILGKLEQRGRALVIVLEGDLGGGKTTFTQGLAQGLEIKENLASPTFVLIKSYRITPPQPSPYRRGGRREGLKNLYHIDCYRLNKPFEEIINNPQNIVVIEWPEKIAEILPKDAIKIKFEFIDENRRKVVIEKNHSFNQNQN
ncbi:MAG: P-loop hydrolase [Parcubacteria group bacterium GW2011_GWF2_39_13b]|nr:MAG: P-loop hydrolase [Parcubacteria group bacterium GW2011_GWF2_39_13b]